MASQRKPVKSKKVAPAKSIRIGTIDYKDTALLRKFISERGKIRARRVTGLSVQEQRKVAIAASGTEMPALAGICRFCSASIDERSALLPRPITSMA